MREARGLIAWGAIAVGFVVLLAWYLGPFGCDARWDRETDWSISAGCRVMVEGELIPEQSVRAIP